MIRARSSLIEDMLVVGVIAEIFMNTRLYLAKA